MKKFIGVIFALISGMTNAFTGDDFEELEGMTVVYAGEFEPVTCPIGGKYDCLTWPRDLLKSKSGKELCLVPSSYVSCSFRCKGLIASSGGSQLTLFLVGMSGDFKKSRFEQYKCPEVF